MQLSIDEAEAFLDETAETFPAALFDERAEIGHTACLLCIFSIDGLAHHLQQTALQEVFSADMGADADAQRLAVAEQGQGGIGIDLLAEQTVSADIIHPGAVGCDGIAEGMCWPCRWPARSVCRFAQGGAEPPYSVR